MMKIAIICGAGMVSGKEVMALELGQGLRASGHAVSYVTSLWGDGKFRERLRDFEFPAACMRLGFISATLSLDCIRMTLDQLIRVPGLWLDYARFLRREKPEHVIHTNWHHLLLLRPFLNTQRDWFWLHEVIPGKPQYRKVFGMLSRFMRGFVPVSHAVKASLLQIGIPESKIRVVHNGMADPAGDAGVPAKGWQGIRIGIIGQVESWKGHQDLLEAFANVATTYAQSELHIFGGGSSAFADAIKRQAEASGVGSRLVWHGFVADRRSIYEQLDICVVPSRTADPLPTVAIEAAFFGLPVVASRIGGLPEIVDDGVTGFLHEAGNHAEIASRLEALLASEKLRWRMGAAARSHAVKCFSRERFVREFECLLGGAATAAS